MRTARRTGIDDLDTIGHELAEEHLSLAGGGLNRQIGRPMPTYFFGRTNYLPERSDNWNDPDPF